MADEMATTPNFTAGLGPVETATTLASRDTRVVTRTRPSGRVKQS